MLYKNIFIDGKNVLIPGVYFQGVNWTELSSSDHSRDIAGMHARIVSPTYARFRIITLSGLIDRRISDQDAVEHLQFLFRLQNHKEAVDVRKVTVQDEYGNFWNISAKIKEPLEIQDGDASFRGEYYRWRVVLESVGTPIFTSSDEIRAPASGYGNEGRYGGFKMGSKFSKKWNQSIVSVEVNSGVMEVPLTIILTTKPGKTVTAPIRILNLQNGAIFAINTNMKDGDNVVIDGKNFKIFKNSADITSSRLPGGAFPKSSGKTQFVVEDANGRNTSDDINVHILFYKMLL